MGDSYNWKIDEDEEQAGKQLILSREDVNGFNAQREGHGSLWFVVFAVLFPFVVVIILALLISRLTQVASSPSLLIGGENYFVAATIGHSRLDTIALA